MGISTVDFEYLQKLMRERTSIVLDSGKEYLAESRLAGLVSQEGFGSVCDLIRQLRAGSFSSLHSRVVDAMTNNETWFFRDAVPFEAFRRVIIPQLIVERAGERSLKIWSAACSTGQEPYSIVMLLNQEFPELKNWDIRVLATDISSRVLERARQGRYSQLEVNRGLPIQLLARYFARDGIEWELAREIRSQVEFKQVNLADPGPLNSWDVVFLRNVLIYFEVETKKSILANIRRQLRPDGYMLMGGAETTLNLDEQFERIQYQSTAYYRPRT